MTDIDWDTRAILGLVAFCLAVPAVLLGIVLVVTQADKQPVRGRQPVVLVIIDVFSLLCVGTVCQKMVYWKDFGCKFDVWQDFVVVMILGSSFLYRTWVVFFKLEVTHERVEATEEALGLRAVHRPKSPNVETMPPQTTPKKQHLKNGSSYGSQRQLLDRPSSTGTTTVSSSPDGPAHKETTETAMDEQSSHHAGGRDQHHSDDVAVTVTVIPQSPNNRLAAGRNRTGSNSLTSDTPAGSADKFLFMRHRWLGTWKFLLPFTVALILLQFIPLILLARDADVPSLARDPGCEGATRPYRRANLGFIGFYLLVLGVFAWRMKDAYDRFFIVREFRQAFVMIVTTIVLWAPFRLVSKLDEFQTDHVHISALLVITLLVGIVYGSSILPGVIALKNPLLQRSSDMRLSLTGAKWEEPLREMATIKDVVNDEMGFDAFKSFLTLEFSVENLLFWREVEVFKSLAGLDQDPDRDKEEKEQEQEQEQERLDDVEDADSQVVDEAGLSDDELFRLAVLIYHRFVKPGSDFEVNLPGLIIQPLTDSFGQFVPTKISVSDVTAGPQTSFRHSIVEHREHVLAKIHAAAATTEEETAGISMKTAVGSRRPGAGDVDIRHVFDAAQKEVFALMERDSFPRFLVSREYKSFLERRVALKREHTRTSIMQQMDLA